MRRPGRGLTVLEVLIAASLLGLIVAGWYGATESSNRAYRMTDAFAKSQATARSALARFEQEARAASRDSLDFAAGAVSPFTDVKFRTLPPEATTFTEVRYYSATETIGGRPVPVLYRESPWGDDEPVVVARNVEAFSIEAAGRDRLTVELRVRTDGRPASLRTEISLRNP